MNKPDGNNEALKLLRDLQQVNWIKSKAAASATVLMGALDRYATWPRSQQQRFAQVVSDWLVEETMGCCYDLDEYTTQHASDFQRFMRAAIVIPQEPDGKQPRQ